MIRSIFIAALTLLASGGAFAQEEDIAKLKRELRAQYSAGRLDEALKTADAVVAAAAAKHGKDSVEAARAWADKGSVLHAKGDAKRSAEAFDEAADIYEKQPNLNTGDTAAYASVLESVGGAKLRTDMNAAEGKFKKALQLREAAHGAGAPETAAALSALANIRFWRREYVAAAETFGLALENLAKGPRAARDDVTLIYQRARCSLRKAKLDEGAEALKRQYDKAVEFPSLGEPAAAGPRPRVINAGIVNGKAITLAKPRYPAEARSANAEGKVEVDVLIDERGDVVSACSAADAHPALAEASETAAYSSKFSPTLLEGNAVKVTGRIFYNYRRF